MMSCVFDLLKKLQMMKYHICNYINWKTIDRSVILRHDINFVLIFIRQRVSVTIV